MKKFFVTFMICICTIDITACATQKDVFYKDREKVKYCEKIAPQLNESFRNALEESDEFDMKIKDTFVSVYVFRGECVAIFAVLTEDDIYLQIPIEDSERIYRIVEGEDEETIGEYYYHAGLLRKK